MFRIARVSFVAAAVTVSLANGAAANLIAHWKFDEVAGSSASDSAGTNTGTLTAFAAPGSTWTTGKIGGALGYDNGSAVVLVPALVPLGGAWTASAWFSSGPTNTPLSPSNLSFHTLFRGNPSNHAVIADSNHLLGGYGNVPAVGFQSSGYDLDALNSSPGWHHLTAVGTGGTTEFFIDGASVGTSPFQDTTNIFAIGNYQFGGQLWSDFLDDTGVFDVVLSDPEILAIYNLANEPALAFDLGQVSTLIDLFDDASTLNWELTGGDVWVYNPLLAGTPGVVQYLGLDDIGNQIYGIVLDSSGLGGVQIQFASITVPEPGAGMLLGLGLLALAWRVRRKKAM